MFRSFIICFPVEYRNRLWDYKSLLFTYILMGASNEGFKFEKKTHTKNIGFPCFKNACKDQHSFMTNPLSIIFDN